MHEPEGGFPLPSGEYDQKDLLLMKVFPGHKMIGCDLISVVFLGSLYTLTCGRGQLAIVIAILAIEGILIIIGIHGCRYLYCF